MSELIPAVTDAGLDEDVKLAGLSRPVLVDFRAQWRGPCRAVSPLLDQLAAERGNRLKIVKLNIDDNPQTPLALGIRGIPTLTLFKNGELAATHVGTASKSRLAAFVEPYLAAAA